MFKVETPTPPHIRARAPHAGGCKFVVFDSAAELTQAAIAQGVEGEALLRKVRQGDASLVPPSDALLAKFESTEVLTHKRTWEDNVTGALPNIPAFLAGVPLNMRRKVRRREASAPLIMVMELTGSTGCSGGFGERGAAYLALARLLTSRRPVELYLSFTFGVGTGMGVVFFRVPTAPLEVASAAFVLSADEFLSMGFKAHRALLGHGPSWAWANPDLERLRPELTYAPAFPQSQGGDIVVFPAMFLLDASAREPVKWVQEQYKKLSGDGESEEGEAA